MALPCLVCLAIWLFLICLSPRLPGVSVDNSLEEEEDLSEKWEKELLDSGLPSRVCHEFVLHSGTEGTDKQLLALGIKLKKLLLKGLLEELEEESDGGNLIPPRNSPIRAGSSLALE
ncbi:hypothetical protein EV421DRAFT_1748002 [Armillaria borealis]|uniref:Uncharacterized protein n=1 Tax=Armillaria borealis TaxID=47425 RepID=A0AA39IBS1_9AGAR|nr:hypothetical protein EV421DRAFT_1748002 [Armillaria borealis]